MFARVTSLLFVLLVLLTAGCNGVNLSLSPAVEGKQTTFEAPLDGATSASAGLSALVSGIRVEPLPADSGQLIAADIGYVGELTTTVTGEAAKTIVIRDVLTSFSYNGPALTFDTRLNAGVPLNLNASSSSGDMQFNLADFTLTGLSASTSSGRVQAQLPASGAAYPVTASSSSGNIEFTVADGAAINFESISTSSGAVTVTGGTGSVLNGASISTSSGDVMLTFSGPAAAEFRISTSSGRTTVVVPEGAAVRLEIASNSSGAITVPDWLPQVEGGEKTGAWESAGYADAEQRILIVVTSTSSGDITVL